MLSFKSFAATAAFVAGVAAESHYIQQINNCGYGTPIISQNFNHLSNGDYTANGPFSAAIAWLDTGGCDFEAVGCGFVEMTLVNGGTDSVDISLIDPHTWKTPISFSLTGSCSGSASCGSADCPTTEAFHVDGQYEAQRQCPGDDTGVVITYC